MDERLLLRFLEVTEAAAIASGPWMGRGNKIEADGAATNAMREKLGKMNINGIVIIGEGELDEAPMLYIGEQVGTGTGPELDIAVDPLEGTNLVAKGQGNSVTVIAVAPRGSMLHAPDMYMDKIAVGPEAAGKIDINASLIENLKAVASAKEKKLSELTIAIQDRDRHKQIIKEAHEAGVKVELFNDGDVMFTVATCLEHTGIDMVIGIGGAPEGVISAVALKSLGGEMQARLLPENENEYNRCVQMGIPDPSIVLTMDHLINSDQCIFSATGVTDGILLRGVKSGRHGRQQSTHSLVTDGRHHTLHFIETFHKAK